MSVHVCAARMASEARGIIWIASLDAAASCVTRTADPNEKAPWARTR
jgi:hypothetical protein